MSVAPRRRVRVGFAWLLIAGLVLTGCAGGARADFAQQFGSDPMIDELELTTGDNMPFTDGVRATVTLSEEIAAGEVSDLLARFSVFMREHSDEPVTITVHADAVTAPVLGAEADTLQAWETASAIAQIPGVESAGLSASPDGDRVTGAVVVISPEVDIAFAVARSTLDALAPHAARPHLTVEDAGTAVRLSGVPGRWLDDAEEAWMRVNAVFPITGVRADAERITLTLADEEDAGGAQALIPRAEPAFQTPILFESPLVLLGLGGTGDEARLMLSGLDEETRSLVRFVWSNDVRAEFRVASAADAAALEAALAALPEAARGGLEVTVAVEQ